jgi:hypothetical protein
MLTMTEPLSFPFDGMMSVHGRLARGVLGAPATRSSYQRGLGVPSRERLMLKQLAHEQIHLTLHYRRVA